MSKDTEEMAKALEECADTIQRIARELPYGVPLWAAKCHDRAKAVLAEHYQKENTL
jgi:bacterioferritin-associated ferredoxin